MYEEGHTYQHPFFISRDHCLYVRNNQTMESSYLVKRNEPYPTMNARSSTMIQSLIQFKCALLSLET